MFTPARWVWSATLIRVVDGDTLDVELTLVVDVGFGRRLTSSGPQRVRLNRVDTWPSTTPRGAAGTAFVRAALAGGPFAVQTLKPYKYGGNQPAAEYMAEVTLADGRNLSDALIAAGHALPYDGRGPRPTTDVV